MNSYSYVENNPALFIDPFGLDKCKQETGCACNEHIEVDWVCVAGMAAASAPAYLFLGLGSAAALVRLGPVMGRMVFGLGAGLASTTFYWYNYVPCWDCVPNSNSPNPKGPK
jgi:hypothetical protein